MTTRELRNDVCALCSYDIGEKDGQFISYANLALRTIYNELDILGKHTLYFDDEKPAFYIERILHTGAESETMKLFGKAYSFVAVGRGRFTVSGENSVVIKDFDTEGTAFRGFLPQEAVLTLSGVHSFSLYSFATFEHTLSENTEEIPLWGIKNSYNMRELVNDFQSFYLPPIDKNGKSIEGAVYNDGSVTLPSKVNSPIVIIYRRIPNRIYIDYPDKAIDIPEEYSELLVALCSYFVCLEDEREAAQSYKELYDKLLSSHKNNSRERLGGDKVITNGWA